MPVDVLINHLIPLLAETETKETETEKLDRWALEYANWYSQYSHLKPRELPNWRAVGPLWQNDVTICDHGLGAFVIWGAKEDMPFSVYVKLDKSTNDEGEIRDVSKSYVCDIRCRRWARGEVEYRDQFG